MRPKASVSFANTSEKTGNQSIPRIANAVQVIEVASSIKHDLARSCFKFWLKIGDEGDKISRKKTGEALAETVFFRNFVTLVADFEPKFKT